MNHIYRLVWDHITRSFKVVSELARSHGKSIVVGAIGVTSLAVQGAEQAKITVASGNTVVYQAPNGVQTIDINTANKAGVSHNKYTNYNVSKSGLILNNNSPLTQAGALQSQLGGQIVPNQNLSNEASLIINEVVSSNKSTLAGYTEVVGGTADVVVANPYGITCKGCGFINTDRVTLTTGSTIMDASGSLSGFNISQGTLTVIGNGLDASNQSILDLVAGNITINGQINGQDIKVVAGHNTYNYDQRGVTAHEEPLDNTVSYAIDSTVLGGMYGNRIELIATDAGVGVRMKGDVAASASDFVLSASGKVELVNNHISATQDVKISSNANGESSQGGISISGTDADNNATIDADNDIVLTGINSAGIALNNGQLTAGNNLTVAAEELNDTATIDSSNASRYGENDTTITTSGDTHITGSQWGAGNNLTLEAKALSLTNAVLYSGGDTSASGQDLSLIATGGDIDVDGSEVTAKDELIASANAGSVHIDSNGQVQAVDNITVTAQDEVTNAGNIIGGADTTITASDTRADLSNSGTLQTTGTLTLGKTNHDLNITNTTKGKILAGTIGAKAGSYVNQGTQQAEQQTTLLAESIDNSKTLILSAKSGSTNSVSSNGNLTNSGQLQSAGDAKLHADQQIKNVGTILTTYDAAQNLTLTADDLSNGGTIDSGNQLTLTSNNLLNLARIQAVGGSTISVDTLINGSSSISNALIYGATKNGESTIKATTSVTNYGALHSNDELIVNAGSIENANTGGISSLSNLVLNTLNSGDIDNDGALYASDSLTLTATDGDITNRVTTGTVDSDGDISISAKNFINHNSVLAGGDINITTTNSFVNETVFDDGNKPTKKEGGVSNSRDEEKVKTIRSEGGAYDDANIYLYEDTYDRKESLTGGMSMSELQNKTKAQIISNGSGSTLRIDFGNSGSNSVAVLSAPNVSIDGNGTFTNESLDLYRITYYRQWVVIDDNYVKLNFSKGTDHAYWGCTDSSYDCDRHGDDGSNYDSYDPGSGWREYDSESDAKSAAARGGMIDSAVVIASSGAGIKANSLHIGSGVSLKNEGSPWPSSKSSSRVLSNDAASALISSFTAPSQSTTSASNTVTLEHLTITLPSNPNGYFVVSEDPDANYLIETNPIYEVGSNFVGSDYLAERYGYNPDDEVKRLGDDSYEAYLVRQQLINETGGNLLDGYADEAAQIKGLMDNALTEADKGDFVYGQALTEEQIANLTSDIVWMVETVVDGQTVLVPQVYLASDTVDSINSGAVIAANDVDIDAENVTNTGGTIEGKDTLSIKAKGDVTNISGTITGGDVSVTSIEGDIINQTQTEQSGNDVTARTAIGKTGEISSTGDMSLDAANDIKVIGADINAAGDGSLKAGNDIVVDTIVDKTTNSTSKSSGGGLLGSSYENHTTTDETNIGSNINIGGKLTTDSGKDTVIGGSNVTVGTGWDGEAGGDISIEARQDKHTETSESSSSGLGVGGGMYGTTTTTTKDFKGTNHGSTIIVGNQADLETRTELQNQRADVGQQLGNQVADLNDMASAYAEMDPTSEEAKSLKAQYQEAYSNYSELRSEYDDLGDQIDNAAGADVNLKAGNKVVVQGSDLTASGNGDIQAVNGIEILDGLDEETHYSKTETTTFGKFSSDSGSHAGTEAGAEAAAEAGTTNVSATAGANASADANAEAGAESHQSFSLMEKTVTEESSGSTTSVGSTLNFGGNLNMETEGTLHVVGSSIEGNDITTDSADTKIEAGRNESWSSSSTKTTSIGIYQDSEASADAGAEGEAETEAGVKPGRGTYVEGAAEVGASAEASASSTTTFGARTTTENSESYDSTHTNSSIKARGNLNMKADNVLTFSGADLESGGDMNLEATDIKNESVQDIHESSSSSTSETKGVYLGRDVSVTAEAKASGSGGTSTPGGASGEAGAEASAEAEATAGLRAHSEGESNSERTVTNSGNSFKAGGNITRTASNLILDEASDLQAEGSIKQSSKTYKDQSVSDTSESSESSYSNESRVGTYTNAHAGVSADDGTDVGISGGVQASTEAEYTDGSESSTTALSSSFKAGRDISLTTEDNMTLEGTTIDAGGKAAIDAGSVKYKAVNDTERSTGNETSGSASGKLGADLISGSPEAEASVDASTEDSSSSSSTSRGGSISGSSISITTRKGDADLEATDMTSSGEISIDSAGDVNLTAAEDKSNSRSTAASGSASFEMSDSDLSAEAEGEVSNETSSTKGANTGSISGGSIKIKAKNDVTLEGTDVTSEGDTNIDAGNNVNLMAAESTEESTDISGEGGIGSDGSGNASGEVGYERSVSSKTTSIKSGGSISITGEKVVDQEANLDSEDSTKISGKKVNKKATNYSIEAGLKGGITKDASDEEPGENNMGSHPSTNEN